MSTTEPSAAMTFTLDEDDTCADCGQELELCRCNNGIDGCSPDSRDDHNDPERDGHIEPDSHAELLWDAIHAAEQARDVFALKSLIAQRDGKPLHEVWIHLEPLRTRKHRLRWRRKQKARDRRALERGRREALKLGLDARSVRLSWWSSERTALAGPFHMLVWSNGGQRADQVLEGYATTGDDLPW